MERDYEQMMPLFVRTLELNPGSIDNITVQLSFARSNDIVNSIDPVIEKTLKSLCQKTEKETKYFTYCKISPIM